MTKILIIEDDPYVRRFYERLFQHYKYRVEMISGEDDVLGTVKTSKPDLILLDIMMPKLNGLQILELLKKDDQTKNTTIVMLSNLSDDQTIKKAYELGATGFIIKSNVPPVQLLDEVENYINKQNNHPN